MQLPEVTPARIGGDVAVDFLNTVDWRLDPERRREQLPTFAHVLAWLVRCGLLDAAAARELATLAVAEPVRAVGEHARVLELREDSYAALIDDRHPTVLQHHLAGAHAASRLVRASGGAWAWAPPPLDLAAAGHLLALELGRLVTSEAVLRLHRCEDPHCGWVFLDTSRQRNRRWCSSADCGNRNRVRRHYARSRTSSP